MTNYVSKYNQFPMKCQECSSILSQKVFLKYD